MKKISNFKQQAPNKVEIQNETKSISGLPALRALSLAQMQSFLISAGFEKYRAAQLYQWIFQKSVESFDEITNLPKPLVAWLKENVCPGGGELIRAQGPAEGTRKVLFRLADGKFVESVLMRDEGRAPD